MTLDPVTFKALTGNAPLSWQRRLYGDFQKGNLPPVIDLPTGLGKTMVMALWLIARSMPDSKLPRRLIYVVDRRTVVDQASDLAKSLLEKAPQVFPDLADRLFISTLRGQLADNREWTRDPSTLAIVIGTVDLIGSALLFSGYRSSFKRRPLEAGFLGQDSLLVLDEAHLSRPFEKLIRGIGDDGPFQKNRDKSSQGKPMRVIRMSATSGDSTDSKPPFMLKFDPEGNLTGEDARDATITERFTARKRLRISTLGEKEKLTDKLAREAVALAQDNSLRGKRIVVFVRRPDDAKAIAQAIRAHGVEAVDDSGPKAKKIKSMPYADSVEVLTGTMRGLERDKLVKKPVLQRFLDGGEDPDLEKNKHPVFLVSTSAGEVGFDLNADHLVGDEATLDSWIQRLGRVNRCGKGEATVVLVSASNPAPKTDLDKACAAATKLLRDLNGKDVGPRALAVFKNSHTAEEITAASTPRPVMVELTDILLDAWSMTSITERMPGRPDVAPWLRGIDEEQAQTTIAWRAEVELFFTQSQREMALEAVFGKHSIRAHESLTVNTNYLLEFFKRIPKLKDRPPNLMTTNAAIRLPRGQVVCRTLQELVDDPGILYADSTLILPARFGGLDLSSGMLDVESIPKTRKADDPEPPSLDVADHEGYEQTDAARSRLRILLERIEGDSWTPKPLPGFSIPQKLLLESDYEKSRDLFDDLKAADYRVRLVQPIETNDEGDVVRSLVILAPAPIKKNKENQLLTAHVAAVAEQAERIVGALDLLEDDPFRIALQFAAKWHDEGKKARVWQVFANNPDPDAPPKGKMAQSRDPKSLRGYRHEFGSLLRIHHPDRCSTVDCILPSNSEACELALHLIATHHGAGRPHFGAALYAPFTDIERDSIHADCVRRFSRLQRKYGWWCLAWLENLLRCADALASADEEVTSIDEAEGGEG